MYKCKLFNEIQMNEICKLHVNEKLNARQISEIFNCGNMTIIRILESRGVYKPTLKRNPHNKHVCWKYGPEIRDLYLSGKSTTEIAKSYNCNHKTVIEILKSYDIDRRDPSKARQKYNYPTDTFKIIDTEEKAYWLGFLYADGCISDNDISIRLHIQDEKHVEKFKSFMQYEAPVKYSRPKVCNITIVNKYIAEDLIDKGCFRKKSSILKFPTENQVPNYLIRHFMRGYFDGDGCLSKDSKRNRYMFSVLGTLEFISSYQKILVDICGCNVTKLGQRHPDRCNNNYTMTYGGKQSINNILDFLYKDATVFLDRKYIKYLQFKEEYNKVYDIV